MYKTSCNVRVELRKTSRKVIPEVTLHLQVISMPDESSLPEVVSQMQGKQAAHPSYHAHRLLADKNKNNVSQGCSSIAIN